VLAEVLRDPELLYLLGLRPGGVQAPMNLLRLECFLRDSLAELGLAGAVRAAQELARGRSDEKGARLALPGAVRLLTIHGSKGLEFPVVILAGIGSAPKNGPDSDAWLTDAGLVWRLSANLGLPSFAVQTKWDAPRAKAEQLRHFYVALTRAKHHLVLPLFGAADKKGSALMAKVAAGALGRLFGEDFAEPGEDPALLELEPAGSPRPRPDVGGREELLAQLGSAAPAMGAPARLAQELAGRQRPVPEAVAPSLFAATTQPNQGGEAPEAAAPATGSDLGPGLSGAEHPDAGLEGGLGVDGARARKLGTLTHLCLELGLDGEGALARARSEGLDQVDAAFVARCVAAAGDLGSTERARTAARVLDEPPVFWRTPKADGGELLVRGYIDRLIQYEDGSVEVLDYKTDRIEPGDAATLAQHAEHHSLQLGLYGLALEAAGLEVRALTLAFLAAETEVVLELDAALRHAVRATAGLM
jgi:ATP-dependent helicase/nuclease subunit A